MSEDEMELALERRLRDLERWQAEHGARADEWWRQQHDINTATTGELKQMRGIIMDLLARVSRMEVRIAIYTALAAGTGTVLAQWILK